MKLKHYCGNLDGLRKGYVIAPNRKRAAEIVRCSQYHFTNFFGEIPPSEDSADFEPETLYTQPYTWPEQTGWTKGNCPINQ